MIAEWQAVVVVVHNRVGSYLVTMHIADVLELGLARLVDHGLVSNLAVSVSTVYQVSMAAHRYNTTQVTYPDGSQWYALDRVADKQGRGDVWIHRQHRVKKGGQGILTGYYGAPSGRE